MRVWLQIQGSRVRSSPGPLLSWRLIMKSFLQSFSSLLLMHSIRVVVSYKWKYVHELLVNCLFKLAQEKVVRWTDLHKRKYVHELLVNCLFKLAQEKVVRWTDLHAMTIAVDWDVKQQNKQTSLRLLILFYHLIPCIRLLFCFITPTSTYEHSSK